MWARIASILWECCAHDPAETPCCIRMVNEDVIDLFGRVNIGTKVVVLPMEAHAGTHGPRG